MPRFSESVYVIITTHGESKIDPFSLEPELKTFEVPEGINIFNILASPVGTINVVCYENLDTFTRIITNAVESLTDEQKEDLTEVTELFPLVSKIQREFKAADRTFLPREDIHHYKKATPKGKALLQDLNHAWDNRFNLEYHQPNSDMLNKRFIYYASDKNVFWLDNKIQIFNLPNQDEDFGLLETWLKDITNTEEDLEVDMKTIIAYLKDNGVKNIIIFDFSCSNFREEVGLPKRDIRQLRRWHYKKQTLRVKPLTIGKKLTRKRGGGKKRKTRKNLKRKRRRHYSERAL